MKSLGDTSSWGSFWETGTAYVSPREVYIWRAKLSGLNIETPKQALVIVQAIGRKIDTFDIRGITVSSEGGVFAVDVVFTSSQYAVPKLWKGGWDTAANISGFVTADSDCRATHPTLRVDSAEMLRLTAPPASIDFWLSRSVLWNNGIGPLQSFVNQENVFKGIADSGPNAQQWKQDAELVEPSSQTSNSGLNGLILLAAVVGVAWLGSHLLSRSRSAGHVVQRN